MFLSWYIPQHPKLYYTWNIIHFWIISFVILPTPLCYPNDEPRAPKLKVLRRGIRRRLGKRWLQWRSWCWSRWITSWHPFSLELLAYPYTRVVGDVSSFGGFLCWILVLGYYVTRRVGSALRIVKIVFLVRWRVCFSWGNLVGDRMRNFEMVCL